MKIVATVRARNEAYNIGRFCNAYQNIADEILVADGGSEDNTMELARGYPKVLVDSFLPQFETKDGGWLNPQGKHVNFLIDWAVEREADWIIFDDCDCVPNYKIREDARGVFESIEERAIYTRRIYFMGDQIFPELHGGGKMEAEARRREHSLGVPAWTSLWAWRPSAGVRADEGDPWHLTMMSHDKQKADSMRRDAYHLDFPYCLLHFSWRDREHALEKVGTYRSSGQQPTAAYPWVFGGSPADPEPFMVEENPDE